MLLSLVLGSQVVLFDSTFNPAITDQAVSCTFVLICVGERLHSHLSLCAIDYFWTAYDGEPHRCVGATVTAKKRVCLRIDF